MAERVECAVIGAGVVGLAIARRLARAGHEVVVLEAAETIGTETSSRNSEVIHAGLYYPTGSLKARLCVAGRDALYRYCDEYGVPHRRLGKLVVATRDDETENLGALLRKAAENGVTDLVRLDAAEARRLEPALSCAGALLSPSTGTIDSHAYLLSLQGDAEAHGAMFAFHCPVERVVVAAPDLLVDTGGAAPMTLTCRWLINAAGLDAQGLAGRIDGLPNHTIPPRYLAKGSYYVLGGRPPFGRLIYPMPGPGGLGIHFTVDMGGQSRFGPDVEWVSEPNYDVDPARAAAFYDAVRRYWPALPDGALQPGYAGLRPKLVGPGAPAGDFTVHGPEVHGVAGLVNLYGIESPGLTASLALADHVAAVLNARPVASAA